jgi:uroporphyrinogen decarboxylase
LSTLSIRENYFRAVRRQGPAWVPWYCGFTPGMQEKFKAATGRSDYADFFQFPFRCVSRPNKAPGTFCAQHPKGRSGKRFLAPFSDEVFAPYYAGLDRPRGARLDWLGVLRVPGSMYHFTRMIHPMRDFTTVAEVEAYPWPAECQNDGLAYSEAELAAMRREVQAHQAAGWVVMGGSVPIFEPGWSLRGLAQMLVDLQTGDEVSAAILDRLTEAGVREARLTATLGCDQLDAGDDVGMQDRMMMPPDLWRRTIKPRTARIFAAAREIQPDLLITYHSDGYIEPIIPDLIEIGVDMLNPVQPECMDQAKIKRLYGDRLCLERCIGTQTVLPFGTAESIDAQVKWTVDVLGRGGGLILAPTHTLEPDVPWPNFLAFHRAVLKHGGYENYPGELPRL